MDSDLLNHNFEESWQLYCGIEPHSSTIKEDKSVSAFQSCLAFPRDLETGHGETLASLLPPLPPAAEGGRTTGCSSTETETSYANTQIQFRAIQPSKEAGRQRRLVVEGAFGPDLLWVSLNQNIKSDR